MAKTLLLFSGGLDSMLVAEILKKQKIEINPVCFKSYFFDCDLAKKSAKNLGLNLKIIDLSEEHLNIIKKPKHGRGQGMNPCIDCHLLMVRKAKEIMEKEKFDFISTGEVLGERPFSQNINSLRLIEKEVGLEGLILRPLSARLLPETNPEKQKIVERKKLFSIQGKSRKNQLILAKKFKIKEFPSPAGGCILTNLEYSKKLKELLKKKSNCNGNDVQILRKGRVFWKNNFLIIVARNEKECKELKKFKKRWDLILEPENFVGPTVLVRGFGRSIKEEIVTEAKKLLLRFSKKTSKKPNIVIKK